MFREAAAAVQRNWVALLIYMGIMVPAHFGHIAVATLWLEPIQEANPERPLHTIGFAIELIMAVCYAAAQTLAFRRLGEDIDRPYWKVSTDKEAFKRFYELWLLLNVVAVALLRVQAIFATSADDPAGIFLLQVFLIFNALFIPFGAAVMFQGRLGIGELRHAVATLADRFANTALIAIASYLATVFLLALVAVGGIPVWAQPVLSIIDAYLTCLIFSWTWLVCIAHRDEEKDSDYDF